MHPREISEEKINRELKITLLYQKDHFPYLLDFFKHLRNDYTFSRADILCPIFWIRNRGARMSLLSVSTSYPPLFHFLLKHTPNDLLSEAMGYPAVYFDDAPVDVIDISKMFVDIYHYDDEQNMNNLQYILYNNIGEWKDYLPIFIEKINVEIFAQAISADEYFPYYILGMDLPLFQLCVNKLDSENLSIWLQTDDLLKGGILLSGDNELIFSVFEKISIKVLNDVFSYDDFRILFGGILSVNQNIVDLLKLKLSQKNVESILLDVDFHAIITLLCSPSKHAKISSSLHNTSNINSLRLLPLISDPLLLKIMQRMMEERIGEGSSNVSCLEYTALYNPAFYNAILRRLAKIEKWENVYHRIKKNSILLTRTQPDIIKRFLVLFPDECNKRISKLSQPQDFFQRISYFLRNDMQILVDMQNEYQYEDIFIKNVFTYFLEHGSVIAPLVKIILGYCIEDFHLRKLNKEVKKNKEEKNKQSAQFSKLILKLGKTQYRLFDSKGPISDSKILQNGQAQGRRIVASLFSKQIESRVSQTIMRRNK